MANRIVRGALQRRFYGATAAAPSSAAKPASAAEVQLGQGANGIKVATQDNGQSLARVVCAIKAGSRYEDPSQRGVSHCLRVASDLTQKENRSFYITKAVQQMGANIACTSTREHLIYTLEVSKNLLPEAMPFLSGMVAAQSLRPWELSDIMPRMEYEIAALAEQPEKRVVEAAHSTAFRETGLGRSIYSPMFQLPELNSDLLREFISVYFTPDRMCLSASNVSLDELTAATAAFQLPADMAGARAAGTTPAPKLYSGEYRENSEDLLAYTVIAGEGASCTGNDMWSYAILEQLLGAGPNIKWASNTTSNRLLSSLSNKTDAPFHVQAFNVNYSDAGLFGLSAVTVPENSGLVLKTAVDQLKELSFSPVPAEALQGARNRVKTSVAFQLESVADVVEDRAIDMLNTGKVRDSSSMLSAIDAVSAADVQNAAKKVLNGGLTMASIGELYNVPYLDQLQK